MSTNTSRILRLKTVGGRAGSLHTFAFTCRTPTSFACTNPDSLAGWLASRGFRVGCAIDHERYRLVGAHGSMVACPHEFGLVTCEGRDAAGMARLLADSAAQERWLATLAGPQREPGRAFHTVSRNLAAAGLMALRHYRRRIVTVLPDDLIGACPRWHDG